MIYSVKVNLTHSFFLSFNNLTHCDDLYTSNEEIVTMWHVFGALIFRSDRTDFHWTVSSRVVDELSFHWLLGLHKFYLL